MVTRKTAPAPSPQRAAPRRAAEPPSNGLGARLRLAREQRGASVRGLARAVGVSPSLVSQIENGRVMPSVGTLYAITTELGMLVDDVFRNGDAAPAAAPAPAAGRGAAKTAPSTAGPVQRCDTRRSIRLASGVRWDLLTPLPDEALEFLHVTYDVGGESCPEDSMVRHGGKEYAVLLSGRLGVKIGFDEYELAPGDSLTFDAQMPHRLWTIGKAPAVAVWVVLNRQGDTRTKAADAAPRPVARTRRSSP